MGLHTAVQMKSKYNRKQISSMISFKSTINYFSHAVFLLYFGFICTAVCTPAGIPPWVREGKKLTKLSSEEDLILLRTSVASNFTKSWIASGSEKEFFGLPGFFKPSSLVNFS